MGRRDETEGDKRSEDKRREDLVPVGTCEKVAHETSAFFQNILSCVSFSFVAQVLDLRLKRDDFAVLDKEVKAKMEIAKLFELHNYTKKVYSGGII